MTRTTALKIVNPVLGVLVFSQVLSGLLGAALPPDAFETLHEGGGILLGIVALLHLALNWNWVRATYARKPRSGAA